MRITVFFFFFVLFFGAVSSATWAAGTHCRAFTALYSLPRAASIDCGREYIVGYGRENKNTLWVAEVLTKANVKKFEKMIGHRHFEEYEEIDPRDFNFSSMPRMHLRQHLPFPRGHKMWSRRNVDLSTSDDPLGERRIFNIAPWGRLELDLRSWAMRFGKVYLVSGALDEQETEDEAAIEGHLRLPGKIWEAVYIPRKRALIVQICRNYEPAYCVPSSLRHLEKRIGFSPFPLLSEPAAKHEIYLPDWID